MSKLTLEHIDPRNGVLVSGLCNEFNEILADHSYNSRKTNRFVPYRVCDYPAPVTFGDEGEFLVGGEWVVTEFGGELWWRESSQIGCGSTKGAETSLEKGVGIHAPGMASEGGMKGGKATVDLGVGIHAPGVRSEGGKKGGKASVEKGVGIHSLTPKEKAESGSKGARVTSNQRWVSTDSNWPPHVSTPAGLSNWQKARGIDVAMRRRIS